MVILYDRFNMSDDIYEVIFSTDQQRLVAKLLIKELKDKGGQVGKTEMSLFATTLHEGEYVTTLENHPYKGKKVKISYNKRQFYDRILTPMKGMGLIEYNLYTKKYSLSENFNKDMMRIGLMWLRELKK